MSGGYFTGLALAFILLLLGFQSYYILSLALEREIGRLRCVLLILLVLAAVICAPAALFLDRFNLSWWMLVFLLLLPLTLLEASSRWVEHYWRNRDRRRLEQEVADWLATLKRDPEHGPACLNLGDLYARLGDREKALAYYREALRLMPGHLRTESRIDNLRRGSNPAPKFTAADWDTVKRELRRGPGLFLLVFLAVILLLLLIYILRFWAPAGLVFVLLVVAPLVFLFRWLIR